MVKEYSATKEKVKCFILHPFDNIQSFRLNFK